MLCRLTYFFFFIWLVHYTTIIDHLLTNLVDSVGVDYDFNLRISQARSGEPTRRVCTWLPVATSRYD